MYASMCSCRCGMRINLACSSVWPSELNRAIRPDRRVLEAKKWKTGHTSIGKWIIRFCYLLRIYLNEVYFSFPFAFAPGSRTEQPNSSLTHCQMRYYLYITKFNVPSFYHFHSVCCLFVNGFCLRSQFSLPKCDFCLFCSIRWVFVWFSVLPNHLTSFFFLAGPCRLLFFGCQKPWRINNNGQCHLCMDFRLITKYLMMNAKQTTKKISPNNGHTLPLYFHLMRMLLDLSPFFQRSMSSLLYLNVGLIFFYLIKTFSLLIKWFQNWRSFGRVCDKMVMTIFVQPHHQIKSTI